MESLAPQSFTETNYTNSQHADHAKEASTSITHFVLKTIRQEMPLTALFKPELRIDLGLFVKDQIL